MTDALDVLLAKRFIARRDRKAIQADDGAYSPHIKPGTKQDDKQYLAWKMTDLQDHLNGNKTFGHYMVSPETQNVKLFAFDIDLTKEGVWVQFKEDKLMEGGASCNPREMWSTGTDPEWRPRLTVELRCMAEGLAAKIVHMTDNSFPVALAYSGNKGVHVYGFTGEIPAAEARQLAIETLKSFNCFEPFRGDNFWRHKTLYRNLDIEIFPKQDHVDPDNFGNLMRLPLGINRKSGQEGFFFDPKATNLEEFRKLDPLVALGEGVGDYLK